MRQVHSISYFGKPNISMNLILKQIEYFKNNENSYQTEEYSKTA